MPPAEQLLNEADAIHSAKLTDVANLHERLMAVSDELSMVSVRLHDAEARARAYRARLTATDGLTKRLQLTPCRAKVRAGWI